MAENAIEIRHLVKMFGEKTAVNDISFTVEKGSLFALLGVNGAGKTTTIRMLTGLSRPTKGDALVNGHSIVTELEKIKAIANISPQETAVAPNLTVKENLELMAGIYKMDSDRAKAKAQEIISSFSMEEVADTKSKTLSGGWQRRLSIGMAMVTEPEILFLDEPTLGLDVLARRELWKIIHSLSGKITIVLTTHYMEEAEALSDKIAVMVGGKIRAIGTLDELKNSTGKDNLEEAFIEIATGGEENV